MALSPLHVLVVGGNGFIGSAVCKAALARGMQVTSISSSGRPYTTPKGHSPAWASKVNWQKADAMDPASYAHIVPGVSAVVHTLGTLLEDGSYKAALREGSVTGVLAGIAGAVRGGGGNPLAKRGGSGSYERVNRDSALTVCETFVNAAPAAASAATRPFVYISAEDVFRPLIPSRYIETKREAEEGIAQLVSERPDYRAVFIRPSLVYHPHIRPLTSPFAALLDLSAKVHSSVPSSVPTPSSILRSMGQAFGSDTSTSLIAPSPLDSMANALTIPPIHVDHVADAVCVALDPEKDVRGPVGVRRMRELIGWHDHGRVNPTDASSTSQP